MSEQDEDEAALQAQDEDHTEVQQDQLKDRLSIVHASGKKSRRKKGFFDIFSADVENIGENEVVNDENTEIEMIGNY